MMSEKDYEVGYGKPPKHSQFEKGQSGNPSGKRKRHPSIAELMERQMASLVAIHEKGKTKRMPARAVLVKKLVRMAIQGDHRAIKLVLDLCPPGQDEVPEVMRFTLKLEDDDPG